MKRTRPLAQLNNAAPDPPAALPITQLKRNWVERPPKVSILCPTYQHAAFIRDALNGFLSQETDFPFEVLVRDDASTDGTQQILKEYETLYPGVVRLIFEKTNTWPAVKPIEVLLAEATGEYIAFCEGDDYWFDPTRLQRLTSILDKNADVSLAEDGALILSDGVIVGALQPGSGSLRTWVLRASALELTALQKYSPRILTGDRFLEVMATSAGERHTIPSYSTTYRIHEGGVFSLPNIRGDRNVAIEHSNSRFWISVYLQENGDERKALAEIRMATEILLSAHPLGSGKVLLNMLWHFFLKSPKALTRLMQGSLKPKRVQQRTSER